MTEFLAYALLSVLIVGFAITFSVLSVLYLHTAYREDQEGRHRTAFWGFGLMGCVLLLITILGTALAVTALVNANLS